MTNASEKISTTVWQLAADVIENKENVIVFDIRDGGDGFYRLMNRNDAIAQGFKEHEVPVLDEHGDYVSSSTETL